MSLAWYFKIITRIRTGNVLSGLAINSDKFLSTSYTSTRTFFYNISHIYYVLYISQLLYIIFIIIYYIHIMFT